MFICLLSFYVCSRTYTQTSDILNFVLNLTLSLFNTAIRNSFLPRLSELVAVNDETKTMMERVKREMLEQTNSRKEKAINESEISLSDNQAHDEINEQKCKSHFEDSAEMFQGLITGDEHYHSRSAEFIRLWG